jgi:hypothetical protein
MASATQRALADRARRSANLMERWCKELKGELARQNPNWDEEQTVVLKSGLLIAMFSWMDPLVREIREFEGNLVRERIHAKKG